MMSRLGPKHGMFILLMERVCVYLGTFFYGPLEAEVDATAV